MKLTKTKLKEIIKEELLNEGTTLYDGGPGGMSIKKYFAGKDKGQAIQITKGSKHYVQLDKKEITILKMVLKKL